MTKIWEGVGKKDPECKKSEKSSGDNGRKDVGKNWGSKLINLGKLENLL